MRHGHIGIGLVVGMALFFILSGTNGHASADSSLWPMPGTTPTPAITTVPGGPLGVVGTNCGTLGGLRHIGNPAAQERCLYDAYTQCQAATLLYIVASVDTGAYHYLTVQSNGAYCAIADRVAPYGVAHMEPHSYPCQGLLFLPTGGSVGGLIAQQCDAEGDIRISYIFAS